ncbi:inositol phosphorylceramide synthase Aur1 [Schizosaccharomyces japonicus yFS275]|uniref:Inositol phosphorylceramide synthase Aur1 n=1 Tax=Schizosaccharomyces japonicus (strain yFS275 / FY16936) TaxID=402676 RepID=B6JVU0_SCHJY|nr:inositol phosphorylceramide synthase Aur1 [Schizosaccharomyces japonicus yFS275]EEB05491.1 inositol phosphorylceramide synthase Aur1 [Schizosaccharomyces japonicus yFS275]
MLDTSPMSVGKRYTIANRATKYDLSMQFNPMHTLRKLRNVKWKVTHLQYIVITASMIYSVCIIQEPGFWVKTLVAVALTVALLLPLTSQFFFPAISILAWLFLFYGCKFIPVSVRPHIWVRVLPALENILYGSNISSLLSSTTHSVLDVIAWLPYGVIHYGAPFIVSFVLFVFAPPGTLPVWARSFGYMNLIGVLIQIFFPCSPPWYENIHGLSAANYGMHGSPGGLARIDALFGTSTYTSTFTNSPLVFGAFPSLHAACAMLEALFLAHTFPRVRFVFYGYVLWLCWCTMYLTHHYFVDLVGGCVLALACYLFAEKLYLPQLQPGKVLRWEYDTIVRGSSGHTAEKAFAVDAETERERNVVEFVEEMDALEMADLDREWSIGSSAPNSVIETPIRMRSPPAHPSTQPPITVESAKMTAAKA